MKNVKIYLLVIVLLFTVSQLQAELVGHWKFDNPADIGYDSSGFDNHGSIAAGAPLYSTDSIRGAGAIEFDGIDDYLYLYDTGQGSLNGDFSGSIASLSMWVKLDNAIPASDSKAGLLKMSGGLDNFYPRTNGFVYLDFFDRDSQFGGGSPIVDMTQWHHLVVIYNPSFFATYVKHAYQNGQLLFSGGSFFNSVFRAPTTPWLGKNWFPNYLDGKVDDVRLYNHALTSTEIETLYSGEPQPASQPYPSDGEGLGSIQTELGWLPGYTGEFEPLTSQTIYFGTDNPPMTAVVSGDGTLNSVLNVDLNSGSPLDFDTTYYWQVDGIDSSSAAPTLVEGAVWSFTTRSATESLEWLFDEGTGTVANDSIGTNHGTLMDGIYSGAPALWVDDPDRETVLEFASGGEWVESVVDWPECPLYGSDYTVSFWAKRTNLDGPYECIIWYDSVSVFFSYTSLSIAENNATLPHNASLTDTDWHQWTVTQSGRTNSIYRDGLLVSSSLLDPEYTPGVDQKLYVARRVNNNSSFFNGRLSKIKILNYAMTDDDIGTMYHADTGIWPCLTPPVYDFNGDCMVDFIDFSSFAADWMDCGRVPASSCD